MFDRCLISGESDRIGNLLLIKARRVSRVAVRQLEVTFRGSLLIMRLSQVTLLLAAAVVGHCSPAKRQGPNEPLVVLSPGSITAPANGTHVEAGHTFTLGIADPVPEWNHCHPGYTPVNLYLVADKPTVSSLNSTQQFSSYLHYYGQYLVNNLPGKYTHYIVYSSR